MLARTHGADELPQINMTPMVDVVLCLLVFFMAATRLYDWDEKQFDVSVPEVADAAPLTAAPDDMTLTILGPGKVALGEETFDLASMSRILRAAKDRYADQGVLIRGDAKLGYQDLADVLSACHAAGIRNVRLPVKPREEPAAAARLLTQHPTRGRPCAGNDPADPQLAQPRICDRASATS